ncbi:hypothetical protein ACFLYA_00285 [Candidatus Dependentiae bacterium]
MKKLVLALLMANFQWTMLSIGTFLDLTEKEIIMIPGTKEPQYKSDEYIISRKKDENYSITATLTIIKTENGKPIKKIFSACKKFNNKNKSVLDNIKLLEETKHPEINMAKYLLLNYWLKHDKKIKYDKHEVQKYLENLKMFSKIPPTRPAPLTICEQAKKTYADVIIKFSD